MQDNRGSKKQKLLYEILLEVFDKYTVVYEQQIPVLGQRFDMYIKELGIAFEFDGVQHFDFIPFFHTDMNGFISASKLDKAKEDFCEENGIALVRFRDEDKMDKNTIMDRISKIETIEKFNPRCLD